MHYKLSPREEIYNRKYKVSVKKNNDKKQSNLCIVFICVYMSISIIITILFHIYTIRLMI